MDLLRSMRWIVNLFYYMMMISNLILFADLYLTIYNPFSSLKKRFKKLLLVMVILIIPTTYLKNPEIIINHRNTNFNYFIAYASIGATILFGLVSTFFVLKSILRLKQTETSPELRSLLVCRSLSQWNYMFLSFLNNTFQLIVSFFYADFIFSSNEEIIRMNILASLSVFAMLVRLREPYVWKTLRSVFGLKKLRGVQYSTLSLNSFINSAMNVEFVCLVLTGV